MYLFVCIYGRYIYTDILSVWLQKDAMEHPLNMDILVGISAKNLEMEDVALPPLRTGGKAWENIVFWFCSRMEPMYLSKKVRLISWNTSGLRMVVMVSIFTIMSTAPPRQASIIKELGCVTVRKCVKSRVKTLSGTKPCVIGGQCGF